VRAELDVDIQNGAITEEYRLLASLPTLSLIIENGGIPVIAGHIGKPKDGYEENLSTKNLLPFFEKHLGGGKFELLENLRFDAREESLDEGYAHELLSNIDVYVNDCFSTSHRKHTSITLLPKYVTSFSGLRLSLEVEMLSKLLQNPRHPLCVIIGGAKVESKMNVIEKFSKIADNILLGGKSAVEVLYGTADSIAKLPKVILPSDFAKDNKDIGEKTVGTFINIIAKSQTILWSGPLGVFEEKEFSEGTNRIAEAIITATKENGTYSVIGGGDTITAVNKKFSLEDFSFVSIGGGAMLNYLATGTLVGIEALKNGRNN
jgi:phosphoglycerate kinase